MKTMKLEPLPIWAVPAHLLKVNPAFLVKADTLGFQELTLVSAAVACSPGADLTLAIDDALPGHIGIKRERSHGVAGHAGRASPDNGRNLAVDGYFPRRNLANHGINTFI